MKLRLRFRLDPSPPPSLPLAVITGIALIGEDNEILETVQLERVTLFKGDMLHVQGTVEALEIE
jgi:hypothetical protein